MSLQTLQDLLEKYSLCLTSPQNHLNPCNKVVRISQHFCLQVFLYQAFLYVKFQSSVTGAFQDCHKTSEIEL